jgi:hypothetical protein
MERYCDLHDAALEKEKHASRVGSGLRLELQVQPRRVCFSQGVGVVHLDIVKHNKMVLELQVQPL